MPWRPTIEGHFSASGWIIRGTVGTEIAVLFLCFLMQQGLHIPYTVMLSQTRLVVYIVVTLCFGVAG